MADEKEIDLPEGIPTDPATTERIKIDPKKPLVLDGEKDPPYPPKAKAVRSEPATESRC